LPLAYAIGSGNLAAIRSLWLHLRAIKIFVPSADHFCLQNLQERFRFPCRDLPHEIQLAPDLTLTS